MSRSSPFAMPWLDAIDAAWPDARRRAGPIALTVLIEIVLLVMLLSLGIGRGGTKEPANQIVTTFDAARDDAPEPDPRDAEPAAAAAPAPSAPATQAPPSALPSPPAITLPRVPTAPPVAPPAAPPADTPPSPAPPRIRAVVRSDMAGNRGPADSGTPGDSQRIAGSGPNGEPLYAAKWYREPSDDEFRGYFSRVTGSGWALINCRTEPEFRVDNCVLVAESPDRGGVGSAVLAMAWQFRVRPPRVGGRSMVGEWVRIRIDYTVTRQ